MYNHYKGVEAWVRKRRRCRVHRPSNRIDAAQVMGYASHPR